MKKLTNKLVFLALLAPVSANVYSNDEDGFDDLYKITTEQTKVDSVEKKRLSDVAFEALTEEMFPETPEMIKESQRLEQERVNALYDKKEPIALTEIVNVSTRPGAKQVEIHIAPLHTSIFTFIDSTGQPWPLNLATIGNSVDFSGGKVNGDEFNNTVRITPNREVGSTNLVVSLSGVSIPIYIKLKSNTDKYYPVPVLMIDSPGPNAIISQVSTIGEVEGSELMRDLVLGIAPDHFKKLKSSDTGVEAWADGADLYVRSKYTPSNPLPRTMTYGYGGYGAFKMNRMPIIYMNDSNSGYEKRIVLLRGEN